MSEFLLSVAGPIRNERTTIEEIERRVLAQPRSIELLSVDDLSIDGAREMRPPVAASEPRIRVLLHHKNCGTGAALRTGFQETGRTE